MFEKRLNDQNFVKTCNIRRIYITLNIEKFEIFQTKNDNNENIIKIDRKLL